MPEDKKDILEFPLEEVSIPQAIVLMMQAAMQCVSFNEHDDSLPETEVDLDRLQLLAEKLEARVEDELDSAKAVRDEPTPEDAPNEGPYTDIEGHHVTLVHEYVEFAQDNIITKVVVDNVIFGLLCNERVGTYTQEGTDNQVTTSCIKEFGHAHEHCDMEGNIR